MACAAYFTDPRHPETALVGAAYTRLQRDRDRDVRYFAASPLSPADVDAIYGIDSRPPSPTVSPYDTHATTTATSSTAGGAVEESMYGRDSSSLYDVRGGGGGVATESVFHAFRKQVSSLQDLRIEAEDNNDDDDDGGDDNLLFGQSNSSSSNSSLLIAESLLQSQVIDNNNTITGISNNRSNSFNSISSSEQQYNDISSRTTAIPPTPSYSLFNGPPTGLYYSDDDWSGHNPFITTPTPALEHPLLQCSSSSNDTSPSNTSCSSGSGSSISSGSANSSIGSGSGSCSSSGGSSSIPDNESPGGDSSQLDEESVLALTD